ncbi:unnamed protein product [Malus baccata var. baccata]
MEQFRRLTRELRETKKTAEEALNKAEAKNTVEGATGTKRQRAEEEDKGAALVARHTTPVELALEAARGIRKSPFTKDILKAKKPAKFTQPKFRLFKGATDLVENIYHFQQQMVLEGDDEALLCKLFPSSLLGLSLTWFRQLKPSTKQNVGESLKSYMTRFTKEMSTLEECDSYTASLAFREGVLPRTKMCRSLIETPPLDMREVMARADGIIRLEEKELIQSKQATTTIVASPLGTTMKDLSGVNPLLSSLHVKEGVPGCLLTSPHCMINKVALYSNLRLKSKAEEYKPRDEDRIKIGNLRSCGKRKPKIG